MADKNKRTVAHTQKMPSTKDTMHRATMRDIAAHLHISINTVHKAIAGKPGVSDSLRARVLAYASEIGYRRNTSASNLSRHNLHAVAMLPSSRGEGRYFYAYLWKGLEKLAQQELEAGLTFEPLAFSPHGYDASLRSILRRINEGDHIDGVLAFSPANAQETGLIAQIVQARVPVELVMGDKPETGRLGAVVADYVTVGKLMAEQTYNLLRGVSHPEVLLLNGDIHQDAHALVAQTFHTELEELAPEITIHDIPGAHLELDEVHRAVRSYLSQATPQLASSVFAVGSEVLANEFTAAGVAATLPVIGSDVFEESIEALKDGTFTNLVYKDPTGLAYAAAHTLSAYLLWGTRPEQDVQMGDVELVFRSNLDHYCA